MNILISFLYLPVIFWYFFKQKDVHRVISEIKFGSRCKSCYKDKELDKVDPNDFHRIYRSKYCDPCDLRIRRNDKLSFLSKSHMLRVKLNRLIEYTLTPKFEMYMIIALMCIFILCILMVIFIDGVTIPYNLSLFVYWSIMVVRGEYIRKKTFQ
jgi:hypothetical protein